MDSPIRLGIDIGSTTIKLIALDTSDREVFSKYLRHLSDIRSVLSSLLEEARVALGSAARRVFAAVTGSAGMGEAERLGLPFVQEVIACTRAVERLLPETDVAIELGGEDAKITYFRGQLEQRMNGSCADGTGAFIDQMASLLGTDPAGLDELAARAETVYPIAARCGVFAKADVQPLVNEGARREDVAASIFQAVVNQTISGLACGRPIRGRVAFLGGPLHYLRRLRERFALTLGLEQRDTLVPKDGRLIVATGAALGAEELAPRSGAFDLGYLSRRAQEKITHGLVVSERMAPLFSDEAEKRAFDERHGRVRLPRLDPRLIEGPAFIGIDAGSTTTKLVAIDREGRILASFYEANGGHPLAALVKGLRSIYASLPPSAVIGRACATGYGEDLAKAALGADEGEVETVAHSAAAARLLPGVEAVLDIGGQDMKFLRIKNGVISSVLLNEACSSGCGSFLESFASSLGFNAASFSALALESRAPVDLGSRCTVFMNSRVKQSQKEGASPADIAAGLAYSVIRNALEKVIRLRSPSDLGSKVVVQGGTFSSDAVLRAFELVSGVKPLRPSESGIMGAYGAALTARSHWSENSTSSLIADEDLDSFSYTTSTKRCRGCANACLLTLTRFSGGPSSGSVHVTGNRCERGSRGTLTTRIGAEGAATLEAAHEEAHIRAVSDVAQRASKTEPDGPPNLYAWKLERLFSGEPLAADKARRGSIAIPRVLNLYENYPLWLALLSELGFAVELSPRSSKAVYEYGMDTIPSESVCYPAKLAHGHAAILAARAAGNGTVFYPCIPREKRFIEHSNDRYNCPIVASYPEVILNNLEAFRSGGVRYLDPFLPIADPRRLASRLTEVFARDGVSKTEARRAVEAGFSALESFRTELRAQGEKALDWIERKGAHGVVLAGRPYHIDPEINHGIPQLAVSMGMAVLSEDSVCHLGRVMRPLRVVDQWAYHSRLYAAASFVAQRDDLDLIQLVSFGCGLDAITSDQVAEILESAGKIYSSIKIDEHANLGAARIRLRSLAAAISERRAAGIRTRVPEAPKPRIVFERRMREEYTILAPQMSPIHFSIIEKAFHLSGYRLEVLDEGGKEALGAGLRSVHNDACYPSILVVGQIMAALQSGRYNINKTAVLVSQTGGGCRATNYIAFIRKALADRGMGQVPVISLNAATLERNPGFRFSPLLVARGLQALLYGDALMRCLYRTRPYEARAGSAEELAQRLAENCATALERPTPRNFFRTLRGITEAFDSLPLREEDRKLRIGVVGEILVKFHPEANNHIVELIEKEGGEAVVPDLYDFLLYSASNGRFRRRYLEGAFGSGLLAELLVAVLELYRRPLKRALASSSRFEAPPGIRALAEGVDGIVQLGNCTGEGWFLTAEMVELIHSGVDGILCLQPFACLPNHVTGKGMLKELRRRFPHVPVAAIDFDPGASEVNQINRVKLLMEGARRLRTLPRRQA